MKQAVLQALLASVDQGESVALLSVTDGTGTLAEAIGSHCVLWLDEERVPVGELPLPPTLLTTIYAAARDALHLRRHRHVEVENEKGAVKVFVEVQARPPHLIIVGAGHIAVPLAAIAKINDFEVSVIDDRMQYAHPARFPTADRVIAGPFRAELQKLRGDKPTFDNHTYLVMVTRGHQYDVESLLEVLDDPVAYIGMIGSQRRVRAVFELLEQEQGIAPEKFDRVYAPIGIDIGARTPAEIAVCIMAEIINVLRNGPAIPLSRQIRQERLARRERVAGTTVN
ncbi:MAG: XdhC family protein [Caldilineaceae bacterium]